MKKSLAILTLSLMLPISAMAVPLEIIGKPLEAYVTMPANGNEVSTKAALREVIPSGWRTLVHKEALLPFSVSWKTGQPWPSVLEGMAKKNGLSVTIDWTQRRIVIRKDDGTLFNGQKSAPTIDDLIAKPEPSATKTESPGNSLPVKEQVTQISSESSSMSVSVPDIKSAESPPLAVSSPKEQSTSGGAVKESVPTQSPLQNSETPAVTSQIPVPRVSAEPAILVAEKRTTAPVAVAPVSLNSVQIVEPKNTATNPTMPVVTQVNPVNPVGHVVVQATPRLEAPAAEGLSLQNSVEELAKRYHVEVVWNTSDIEYAGELQVAGLDLGEDLSLIYAQLGGHTGPVQFELYRQSEVLVVSENYSRKPTIDVITTTPYSGKLAPRKGTAFNLNAATR